jgi:hypothetical protein
LLPPKIRELDELIGITAALQLVDHYGGTHVYVPAAPPADHPLVKLIGLEAAQLLARRWPSEYVKLPRCAALMRAERDERIRTRHAAGESGPALARAFRMTERNVWYILASSSSSDSRQLQLL